MIRRDVASLGCICVTLALVTGCAASEAALDSGELEKLLTSASSIEVAFGLDAESDTSGRMFSRVAAARITATGEHVVIADGEAPFVRVFTRSGELRAAFVGNGDGPLEARAVYVVNLFADSAIVLRQGASLRLFDFDGRVSRTIVSPPSMSVEAIAACGDRWYAYGPSSGGGQRTGAAWIREFSINGKDVVERPLFTDTVVPRAVGYGRGHPVMMKRRDTVYAYHEYGRPPRLLRWTCHQPEVAALAVVPYSPPGDKEERSEGKFVAFTIMAGDAIPSGYAIFGGAVVWMESILSFTEISVTRVSVATGTKRYHFDLRGSFKILDQLADDVLVVGVGEPVPHVILVPEPKFLRAVGLN